MAENINQAIEGFGETISEIERLRHETIDADFEALQKRYDVERILNIKMDEEAQERWLKYQRKRNKALQEAHTKELEENYKATVDAIKMADTAEKRRLARAAKAKAEEELLADRRQQARIERAKKAQEVLGNMLSNTINAASSKVDQAMDSYTKYITAIETRVQGSGLSFNKLARTVTNNIGFSPYVSQQKVLDNMANLIESGVMYNVEQRAFLQTISENIARTFNAANGTLIQLIRIQQADSTAARLGMEASITRFLNANFRDSSYMNSGYQSVMQNLMGASSLMDYQQAVEFEYNVQKWLGSLGALGVSDNTLSQIAQGLNYLGTGNVTALTGNTQLLNLLTIAAQRSGENIASLLTTGITAQQASNILSSIASFGQSLGGSGNKVVMSKYAELFGLGVSDISALQNLTSEDISNIMGYEATYGGALNELNNQLKQVPSRMHISQKINTLMENTIWTTATGLASNAATYSLWKVTGLLDSLFGDALKIPTVGALGNFVDIKATVPQLAKLVMMGGSLSMGLIGQLMAGTLGHSMLNGLDSNAWNAQTYTRGQGKTWVTTGVDTGISESYTIGNTDGAGIQNDIARQAKEEAQSEQGTERSDTEITIEDKIPEQLQSTHGLIQDIYSLLSSGLLTVNVPGISNLGA